jgi:hypothetical protein
MSKQSVELERPFAVHYSASNPYVPSVSPRLVLMARETCAGSLSTDWRTVLGDVCATALNFAQSRDFRTLIDARTQEESTG